MAARMISAEARKMIQPTHRRQNAAISLAN